ncbi:hypothetical protein BUALT_Bualt04G0151000 [Buddleja alternifolia]|uniref:Uncharacterized protein n=1 Tax=Buddleja alternifolia TaxID=168488 RepID=A0AAV6XVX9_9LAMI|nr:hypothetical protein BUALT_Bualt04G0151000 [Buddleja alternifolia]
MGRPPCCDKANVKRGPWTAEEDAKILAYVASHGIGNWTLVPQKAGLNRCGKSCRLRWTNYLRPDLKHDNFTPEEEECILELHKTIGSRWSLIAKRLPGRTDNDVKNYWNTKLKKKLTKMGIDPITHKPFSQLFNEYGKISGFPKQLFEDENNLQNDEKPSSSHSIKPHFFNETASSDSFSSSTGVMHFACATSNLCEPSRVQMSPSSPFVYDEYSFDDMDQMQECEYMGMLSLNGIDSVPVQEEGLIHNFSGGNNKETRELCASSSAADSFVEAILAHDNEMRLQFPDILDENYHY